MRVRLSWKAGLLTAAMTLVMAAPVAAQPQAATPAVQPVAAAPSALSAISAAAGCSLPLTSQQFLRWGDYGWYYPLYGGDFESAGVWTLNSAASRAWQNSSVYINPFSPNQRSLKISAGGVATATFSCVPSGEYYRVFMKSASTRGSIITMDLTATDPYTGRTASKRVQYDSDYNRTLCGCWLINWAEQMPTAPGGSYLQTVKIRISVAGTGTWFVDDFWADPWRST